MVASALNPPHSEPLIEEEVQILTEHRTNSSTGAREATQNVKLMLEIDSEGYKHRNSKANNSTVMILCLGADSGAIPEASIQPWMLATEESEAETNELEAETKQAEINK